MSHFNVALIVWAKSQDSVHKPQHTTLELEYVYRYMGGGGVQLPQLPKDIFWKWIEYKPDNEEEEEKEEDHNDYTDRDDNVGHGT